MGDGVARLGLLMEMNRLEIKIAVPKARTGLYHEKIGLFFDETDFVAFTGSSSSKLTESLFLHYVGQPPRDDYPVLEEYRKVLDEPKAVLPSKASRP